MNKWVGIGRLTSDPDVRSTESQQTIARYRLAVDRKYKREGEAEADFLSCVAFGKSAEFVEKYLKKGMKVAVVGRIQTGSYTKQDGTKVYTTDIVVEEHEFCESRGTAAEPSSNAPATQKQMDDFMSIPEGFQEELPFN